MPSKTQELLNSATRVSSIGKTVCIESKDINRCWLYNDRINVLGKSIILPDELQTAKNLEANSKLITGLTKNGELFTFNPRLQLTQNLGKVRKFSSTSNQICAIDKQFKIVC